MIAGFFIAMFSGHIYLIGIVTAIQLISFKEVIAIANVPSKAKNLKFTRSLNWYFLGAAMYYLYGESVIYYFKHIVLVDKVLLPFAVHHRFISFTLYVMGRLFYIVQQLLGLTERARLCVLRCFPTKRTLSLPIHTVCLDTYGPIPDCRSSTFRYE
jgi:CDP-diglyceride synthetase